MGQMQNKRYTLGMTSLPCHSRHEHSKHSRSRVGVLVHETRPSRWGSSVMEDLGLQKTLKRVRPLSTDIGTPPLASDCI